MTDLVEELKEKVARIAALHGHGTVNAAGNRAPPNSSWTQAEWERRILECIPFGVEQQVRALADEIHALYANTIERLEGEKAEAEKLLETTRDNFTDLLRAYDDLRSRLQSADVALRLSRDALSIAAGWARQKGDSDNARQKIKRALDAIRAGPQPQGPAPMTLLEAAVRRLSLEAACASTPHMLTGDIELVLSELSRLQAEVERRGEALEPFSDIDGEGDEDFPDDTKVTVQFGRSTNYTLTLGDFRRARSALSHTGEAG